MSLKRALDSAARSRDARAEKTGALLPNRHPKTDFFVADIIEFAVKDDQATMEAAVFSLSTRKDNRLWRWKSSDGHKSVEVAPGSYGRATQHDKDILIFCTSQLVAAMNEGRALSRKVRFSAYSFLVATNRNTSGDDYRRFVDALNRLKGTQITTNIKAGTYRVSSGFGLIDSWTVVEKSPGDARIVSVEVTLSEWLFNAINAREVLTIHRDYFRLRRPLERRLYEIARKHVGKQRAWQIGIDALRDKCGSTVARLRQFKDELTKIAQANTLPDYGLRISEEGDAYIATFFAREAFGEDGP